MKALDAAEESCTEYPQTIAVVRAVILTGARISELLSLQWRDIRRDELELHLRETKTGFSRRPISAAALALLDGVERMPGVDHIFRAPNAPTEAAHLQHGRKGFSPRCCLRWDRALLAAHHTSLVRDNDREQREQCPRRHGADRSQVPRGLHELCPWGQGTGPRVGRSTSRSRRGAGQC